MTMQQNNILLYMCYTTLIGFHYQERADALLDEALRMKSLDHPNVLTLIGVCMDALSAPCVVMPYMANGSLLTHLRGTNNHVLVNSHEQRLVREYPMQPVNVIFIKTEDCLKAIINPDDKEKERLERQTFILEQ